MPNYALTNFGTVETFDYFPEFARRYMDLQDAIRPEVFGDNVKAYELHAIADVETMITQARALVGLDEDGYDVGQAMADADDDFYADSRNGMFSPEGDDAVDRLLDNIQARVERREFANIAEISEATRDLIADVAKTHGEVRDTAVREIIAERLDVIVANASNFALPQGPLPIAWEL